MKSSWLVKNTDVKLGIGGIGIGLILFAYASARGILFLQEAALVLPIASGVYLLLKKTKLGSLTADAPSSVLPEISQTSDPRRKLYVLSIIFFGLFAGCTLLLTQHGWQYYAFLAVVLTMTVTLAIEILLSDSRGYSLFILGKLMALGILIRAGVYYYYPSTLGGDPWYFADFTNQLIQGGRIPDMPPYDSFPVMPILAGSASQVTDLAARDSLFMVGALGMVSLVFIFLIGRRVFNEKVALFSVLILVICSQHILLSYYSTPNNFGLVVLLPLILFLILEKRDMRYMGCAILVLMTITLTHSIFSAMVVGLLAITVITFSTHRFLWQPEAFRRGPGINLVGLGVAMVIGYWMHISGWFDRITSAFAFGWESSLLLTQEVLASTVLEGVKGHVMENLPGLLFMFFAIIGSLYVFSAAGKKRPSLKIPLILIGLGVTLLVFILTNVQVGAGPWRWVGFMMICLAIPCALGILFISVAQNKARFMGAILASLILFTGLMLTSHSANINENITPWVHYPRQALTSSELQAAETVHRNTDGLIYTDWYYKHAFTYRLHSEMSLDIAPVISGEKEARGILVLREEIRDDPSYFGDGTHKPDESIYDSFVNGEQYNLIYDCGPVKAARIQGFP